MSRPLQRLLLAVLALVPCVAACRAVQDVETLYLPERESWECVNTQDDGHQTLVECVPTGQTLSGWRELITIQGLDDRRPKETPKATMERLRAEMQKRGGELEWSVVEEDASSVLYEWTLRGAPGAEDQGEIARLVQGKDAMHRAAYAYKVLPLSSARRTDRTTLLRNARLVKGEKDLRAARAEFFTPSDDTPAR